MAANFTLSCLLVQTINNGKEKGILPMTEQEAETELNNFQTNAARIRHYYRAMKRADILPISCSAKFRKNEIMANIARKRGKSLSKTNYLAALESLNQSLCLAPRRSEVLGLAYADRSKIFAKAGFYSFALENIELALTNNYPEAKKSKLQKRKNEILKLKEEHQDSYDIYGSIEDIMFLNPEHPTIPFIVNGLAWAHNDDIGRHIVTTRDLEPGEILVLEDPFLTTPFKKFEYVSCYNCTAHNFYNLIPCPNSTRAMFCSEVCRQKAWDSYYRYECPIIDGLFDWVENNFAARATFKALMLFQDRTEFKQLIVQGAENPFEHNFRQIDEITKFRIFNSMSTNEDRRSKLDILEIVCSCAVVYHMVKERTELKEEFSNDNELEDVFLELLMRYHQIEEVNNFNILEPFKRVTAPVTHFSGNALAQGNYLVSFLFGHSCAPNVAMFPANSRGKLGIVTLHPIKAGDQVSVSYGPYFIREEKLVRQVNLILKYQFDCRCVACEDVERFSCKLALKKLNFSWDLLEAASKTSPAECLFNDEAQACAIYVLKNAPELISDYFDEHYPCAEIRTCEEFFLDAILIRVFKKPMDLIYCHPSEKSWFPAFYCLR